MSEFFWRGLLALAFALPIGFLVRLGLDLAFNHRRDVLAFEPGSGFTAQFKPIRHVDFVRSNDQGNFGEILTAMIMTARGWWSINGKVSGPQGIDGIFVKHTDRGWQACLIETKTNSGRYLPRQMSDQKLLKDLEKLYLTAPAGLAPLYRALYQAIERKSPALTKELWRHTLENGETQAFRLDRSGIASGLGSSPGEPAMMRALFDGLSAFDRQHVSIHPPSPA